MSKPKPETVWCVVSKDGEYCLWSVGWSKDQAVWSYVDGLTPHSERIGNPYQHEEWKDARRHGHRCVRVIIQPREE